MSFKMNEHLWLVLLDFMESHPSFARGQFSGPTGKITQRKLWEELAKMLNSLGYGERTPEKWQKTWADIKYSIKKKSTAIQKDIFVTGGGAGFQAKLNAFEQRVVGILGRSFVEGVGSMECGLNINKLPQTQVETQIPLVSKSIAVAGIPETIVSSDIEVCDDYNMKELNSTINIDHAVDVQQNKSYILTPKIVNQKRPVSDHSYYVKQPKKRTEEIENKLYQETIDELREIKSGVFGISEHMKSMSETLKEIKIAISQNKNHENI